LRPQYHQTKELSEGYIRVICNAAGIFRKTGYQQEKVLDSIKRLIKFFYHWYEPQSKLWKQFPQQAAGLFNLPIPLRRAWHAPGFTFGIGVSQ